MARLYDSIETRNVANQKAPHNTCPAIMHRYKATVPFRKKIQIYTSNNTLSYDGSAELHPENKTEQHNSTCDMYTHVLLIC